jgi:iron complex transport system substrate-binding protein
MIRRLALALVMLAGFSGLASASPLPRIASINLCTDQLLLAIADRDQILGLSPYARNARSGAAPARLEGLRLLSGQAEDLLILRPDITVSSQFTRRATREMLLAQGLRLEEFALVRTVDEARDQVRRMGVLAGQPARAEALVESIDTALAEARASAQRQRLRVLPLQRRGWVSGTQTLTSSILDTLGLANVAEELGLRAGGFVGLEAIVAAQPDFILISAQDGPVEDQGRAFLVHPALAHYARDNRRLVLSDRLTLCGGAGLVEALNAFRAEIDRVVGAARP